MTIDNRQLTELRDTLTETSSKAQIEFELEGVERGIQNIRRNLMSPSTSLVDTESGRQIFQELMELITRPIMEAQEEALEGIANGGRGLKPTWWWLIVNVPPDKLAFIAIRALLTVRMTKTGVGRKAASICLETGNAVKMQTEYERWAKESKETSDQTGEPDLAKILMKRAKNMNARQWSNWRRKIDAIEKLDWTREQKFHIGAKLLDILILHGGGFFELRYVQIRHKTERQVFLSTLCRKMIEDVSHQLEINTPVLRPMISPPRSWSWDKTQSKYTGGYFKTPIDFIRGGIHKHTADLDKPISQETLDACDAVGRVWWRVNNPALVLVKEARELSRSLFDCIPDNDPIALPPPIDDKVWESWDRVQRSEHKHSREKIHTLNAGNLSKREAAIRKINIASEMTSHDKFTYPQKIDSRTRLYPIPPDLNPQSDSIGRGLIEFAIGEPLGERGLYWLKVRLSDTFGNDKGSFEDMQKWAEDHYDLIVDSIERPLDGERFWSQAEKELEFWVTAREFVGATRLDDPSKFISHLPSHMDGSNHGLQLLSLFGRDPTGAKLTNCSSDDNRYDIYQVTADVLSEAVAMEAAKGSTIAQRWVGNISRYTTKRACMTTSYGVTPRGIQDQLIDDGHTENLEGLRLENAQWLRDRLLVALEETVVASRPIMAYFQECATRLAQADRPLRWRTPTGSIIQQSYWNISKSDVKTVMGSDFLWDQNPDGGLNQRKQSLGSAPNVIHSLDASLLQKVVNQLVKHDVYSFTTVHDSFATHFAHTDLLRDIIRKEAYQMFKGNWLKDEFHRYVQSNSPVELPEPPEQGEFNVREVLKAPYFFA